MTTVALKKQTDFNQDFEFRFHGGKYQEMFLIRFQKEQTVNRKKSGFRASPFKMGFVQSKRVLYLKRIVR